MPDVPLFLLYYYSIELLCTILTYDSILKIPLPFRKVNQTEPKQIFRILDNTKLYYDTLFCDLFADAFSKLGKATFTHRHVCPYIRIEKLGIYWTDFNEISYLSIFENMSRIFKFRLNLTRIPGTLRKDLRTFLIISRSILLRIRNVSDTSRTEYPNKILCPVTFSPENHALYEIMWKNIEGLGRSQMTCRMRIAFGIHKATNENSEYVIFIDFPWQQWLPERASFLSSYTHYFAK